MELGDLTNLNSLWLSNNSLSGSIPVELGDLTNLSSLWLSRNSLSGSIPAELGDLTNLTDLLLHTNSLSGSIPAELGDLTKLGSLSLSRNSFSGSIPVELGDLTNLTHLSLYNNSFSGSIPVELGDLTNLSSLWLSDNSLSGSIPVELGDLTNLSSLWLSDNSLSGTIPLELGDLTNLNNLYLGNNELSGSMPSELSNLANLEQFSIDDTKVCLPSNDSTLTTWYGNLNNRNPSSLPDCVAPAAPNSLAADVQSLGNAAVLSWDAADDVTIERYQVRWKTDGDFSTWADVPDSDEDTTSHTVSELTSGISHTFEVRAVNATGDGAASSVTATPEPGTDYDSDDDGLIEISNLAQLNAIRWDVDGDGAVDDASNAQSYATAFPDAVTGMGCATSGCAGYELTADLDFDTNGDGKTNQPMPKDGTTGCVADTNDKWPNDHADCDYDDYWNNGNGWEQIGWSDNKFATTFDGNGNTISNLYINRGQYSRGAYAALFAYADTASVIKNVGLVDVNISGSQSDTGAIAGILRGTLSNSFATGEVKGSSYVGGLVGHHYGTISESYAMVDVVGTGRVGGLVGYSNFGTVSRSYATGAVKGQDHVGGLVGWIDGSITASYSIGLITLLQGGTDPIFVGGLAGYIGNSTITNSYFDTETSDQSGSKGKSTSDMKTSVASTDIYVGWGGDDSPWDFGTAVQYPALKVDFNGDGNPTVEEFGEQRTNAAPTVANEIADRSLAINTSLTIGLKVSGAAVFDDVDLDDLTYTTASSDTTVATVSVGDADVTVTGISEGTSDVTITASDTRGATASDTFTVTVTLGIDYDSDSDGLIEISNLAQLNAIRWDLDGNGVADENTDAANYAAAFAAPLNAMGCHNLVCEGYELTADLDFDTNGDGKTNQPMPKDGTTGCVADTNGKWPNDHADCDYDDYWNNGNGWLQIGWGDSPFTVTFDGSGHTISNLYINRGQYSRGAYAGLFAYADANAVIRNVGLIDVNIKGRDGVGSIVGSFSGTLTNTFATGEVTGGHYVGGLTGTNAGSITSSYAKVKVEGTQRVGGLVGNLQNGTVSQSYATGEVKGNVGVGGLAGFNYGSITHSFSSGTVSGTDPDTDELGGLAGYKRNASIAINSYWDTETSKQLGSQGGQGRTTSEMKTSGASTDIYVGWGDIGSPWDFGTAVQYPALKVDFNGDGNPTVEEFGEQRTNAAPTVANEIEDKSVERGKSLTIALEADDAPVFTDEDLEKIIFSAESTNTAAATVAISESELTVTGVELGTTDVTVTATDARGKSTTDTFTVTVTLEIYDDDEDHLIEISNLAQLNAIRWDLNGDGVVDAIEDGDDPDATEDDESYAEAFPDAHTGMGCKDNVCQGYELTADLDFDTNGDGTSTQPKPKDGTTGCVADADGKWPNDHADCDYDDYWNDGEGWLPIGDFTDAYRGTFDGNGHTIDNLYILRDVKHVGFFAVLSGEVKNIGLRNAYVGDHETPPDPQANAGVAPQVASASAATANFTPSTSTKGFGILAGENSGTISASFATGKASSIPGFSGTGLLVGLNSGTITGSFTHGTVTAQGNAGGLVGWNVFGTVSDSYSVGDVTGSVAGGLIGITSSGTLTDSYAATQVSATFAFWAGGLVGVNDVSTITDSYWDKEIRNLNNSNDVTGKTTSELQTPESATGIYANWESDVWDFGAQDRYPALKADWDGDENPTVAEFGNQRPPRVPEVANAILDQSIVTEGTVTINLETVGAAVFNELDGAELTYTVTSTNLSSGDDAIVEVTLAGAVITVTASQNPGKVEITVTATNHGDLSISDVFEVTVGKDYDAYGDNGLIEVSTLAQLNAIRWDLDGDGLVDAIEAGIDPDATDDDESYEAAFPFAISSMGCPSKGCGGYELVADLDFDTNEDGKVDQPKPIDGTTGCVADADGNWPVDHADCDYDDYWNGGKGWDPLGSFDALLSARLVGNGKVISNLFINRAESDVGLIRRMSWSVYNMVLDQVNVTGSENTGGLVGFNTGTGDVYNSTVSGVVNGDINTGGLVGSNNGNIFSSYATGTVTGAVNTGGLVGSNIKDIHSSYATVAVTGAVNTGGLVGLNSENGSLNGSYATGDVTGKLYVGGLVGRSNADGTSINNSYAEGDVNGQTGVGGLVGSNQTKAKVSDSYSIGPVIGDIGVGELIGRYGPEGGVVERSFWVADTDDACDQTTSDGGTCITTTDLQASLPTGWSTTIWDAGTATQYPALTADWDGDDTRTVDEFGNQRPTTTTDATTSDD